MAAALTAAGLALAALFGVGAAMSRYTGRGLALSGGRMTLIGGAAALITFWIGKLLGVTALG
jgi:VIT1/CCC1 family predicted Fe2+/Mn2+ transporter